MERMARTKQPIEQVPSAFTPRNGLLQRKCACGGSPGVDGMCDKCRDQRLSSQQSLHNSANLSRLSPPDQNGLSSSSKVSQYAAVQGFVQAELSVSQPGDRYEQEADRVAEQVMRMPDSDAMQNTRSSEHPSPLPIQRLSPETEQVHHQPDEEEEEETLQAKEVPGHTATITPDLEIGIHSIRGDGLPLDAATRAYMEPRFGHDFSQVRVHNDGEAARLTRTVNALAFTSGQDIFFREGEYDPTSFTGQRLLAHELAHTVQQASGPVSGIPRSNGALMSGYLQLAPETQKGKRPTLEQQMQDMRIRQERYELRTRNQRKAFSQLGAFQNAVEAKVLDWQNAALTIGSAYARAINEFEKAEKRTAADEALFQSVLFAALTVGTAGVLSWMVPTAEAARVAKGAKGLIALPERSLIVVKNHAAISSLKHTLEGGSLKKALEVKGALERGGLKRVLEPSAEAVTSAGSAIRRGITMEHPKQVIGVVKEGVKPQAQASEEELPQVYQNRMVVENNLDLQTIKLWFNEYYKELENADDSEFDTVNLEKRLERLYKWLDMSKMHFGLSDLPGKDLEEKEQIISEELERGIWARWIPRLIETEIDPYLAAKAGIIKERTIYHSPGRFREGRFNTLGITKAAGIGEEFSWWWTSEKDIDKLVAWAKDYVPHLLNPHIKGTV